MSSKRSKKQLSPRTNVKPGPGRGVKLPKADAQPLPVAGDDYPTYSFHYADRSHNGSWRWPSGDEASEIINFLCDMAKIKWSEIMNHQSGGHRKHHPQAIESLCREAQDRLTDLHYDEIFTDVFRFRLSGRKRLWGSLVDGIFYVLWWDPEHQVYPTERN